MTAPHWSTGYQVAFDLESTSVDPHEARIVTAAVIHAKPSERPRALGWVVDPGVPVPAEAAAIHGWTDEKIAAHRDQRGRARKPADALFEVAGQCALAMNHGIPVVGMNLSYDLTLLEAECRRHQVPTLADRLAPKAIRGVVDVMVIEKHFSKRKTFPVCECGCGAASRRLGDLCLHWKVAHVGAHDAGGDALATLRLLARLVDAYPDLARMPLPKLFQSQIEWKATQMRSLASWFRRSGEHEKAETVCGSWPVHGDCCAQAAAVAS